MHLSFFIYQVLYQHFIEIDSKIMLSLLQIVLYTVHRLILYIGCDFYEKI